MVSICFCMACSGLLFFFFFQAEDGIRDLTVTGVQTCALPIYGARRAIGKPERFDSLRRYLGGSTFLVGVVFAASPLVDTAFIPLGMIRYSLPKTLLSLYTGKFIWILTVLYVARQSSQLIPQTFGGDLYTTILSIALLIPTAYFLIMVDWENRLLGRKNTLRNRIIARIRNYFSKEQGGTSTATVNS